MLKLGKGTRALAIFLVVLMLAATSLFVFADVISAAAPAVNDPLIAEDIVITQDEVNVINLKGKLDTSFINDPAFGVMNVVVRIGANELGSQVKKLPYDDEGNVDYDIVVNAALALEYGNYVPVVISYSYIDGSSVKVAEITYYFGVITYDLATGVLGVPAGAEYLAKDGMSESWKPVTTPYAPTDAKGFDDEAPSMNVVYESTNVKFDVITTVVEESPEVDDAPFVKDMTDKSFTIVTDPTLEYVILDATSGIDDAYQNVLFGNAGWFRPEGEQTVIDGLKAEGIYTVWVRIPAGTTAEGTLASAPVCLGRINLITEVQYEALNAFLVKYHEVTVIKGKNLYTPETPVVTADPVDTKALNTLYNILDATSKKLITVAEKAEYLVISDYLANHQEMVYDELDALREKYEADVLDEKLNAAFDAFGKLKLNAEQQEMFAEFDDTVLAKKIAFAYIKIAAFTENGAVDVDALITEICGEEMLTVYAELVASIEDADTCIQVDELFYEADTFVIYTKFVKVTDKLNDKYNKYATVIVGSAYSETLDAMYEAAIAEITALDNTCMITDGTVIVDEVIVDMLRGCAEFEAENVVIQPEADADAYAELLEKVLAAIEAESEEYEIGLALVEFRAGVTKLNVIAGIPLDEDVDEVERAIDRVYGAYLEEIGKAEELSDVEALYATDLTDEMIYARDNYQYFNFINDYKDVLDITEDTVTLDDVAAILEALEAALDVEVDDYGLYDELDAITTSFNDLVIKAYVDAFKAAVEKDNDTDERKANIEALVTYIENTYCTETENAYNFALASIAVYDKRIETVAALEALKNGADDVLKAIIDEYIERVNEYPANMSDLYGAYVAQKAEHFAFFDRELKIANSECDFLAAKAEAKAEIESMRDGSAAVDAVVDKYLAELNKIVYKYNNVEDVDAYNTAAMNSINNVKNNAKVAVDFEKARAAAIAAVGADAIAKKGSGKYSEDQIKQLDSKLNAATVALNNLYVENGNTVAEIEATKAAALADLASVEVSVIVAGTPDTAYPDGYKYESGLWATITNYNGMNSALNVTVAVVDADDKELSDKFDVEGVMTNDQANVAVDGKSVAFAFKLNFSDAALLKDDNGFYTVMMRTPAEVKDLTGICVMAEGDGVNYVFETTVDGDYIIFKTNKLDAVHVIVSDKEVNLTWLIVVLAVLIAIEAVVIIFFVVKMKKGKKLASFAPFLAVMFTPAGVIPITVALGVVSAIGAAAATVTVVKATQKKKQYSC